MHRATAETRRPWYRVPAALLVANALAMGLLLAGCVETEARIAGADTEATISMTETSQEPAARTAAAPAIPAIDGAAPAEFQTATFALG